MKNKYWIKNNNVLVYKKHKGENVMNVNIENLKEVLKKATLNYKIDNVQLNYDEENDVVWSKMMSPSFDAVTIIRLQNNVFVDVKEDLQLNFANPKIELKPFLDLFEDVAEVDLKINETNIVLNKQVKVHFDDPSIISSTTGQKMEAIKDYFVEFSVDEDFMLKFENIKKIGNRFGKVYMVVKDSKLYIETTDKENAYSNSINYELCTVDYENVVLCFDYQFFINMMSVINDNYFDFKMSLCYIKDKKAGLLKCFKEDEKYYLISKMDM